MLVVQPWGPVLNHPAAVFVRRRIPGAYHAATLALLRRAQPATEKPKLRFIEVGDFIKEFDIKIAMIATPASEAQSVAEMLVANNIKAILTYASTILNLPPEIRVEYSDPIISLQHISYYL